MRKSLECSGVYECRRALCLQQVCAHPLHWSERQRERERDKEMERERKREGERERMRKRERDVNYVQPWTNFS